MKALWVFLRWFLLGAGVLFFGTVALTHLNLCTGLQFWTHRVEPLLYFVLSGAVTVALLAVMARSIWRTIMADWRQLYP